MWVQVYRGRKILYLFDKFTVDRNEHENVISKELAREWSKQRPNESDAYRYKRCITLNQFAGYLSLHDRESATCYAPKPKKHSCHISTRKMR